MTTDSSSHLYFLTDFELSLFSDCSLHCLALPSNQHRIIHHRYNRTNLFENYWRVAFFQGGLYFLDHLHKDKIFKFTLNPPSLQEFQRHPFDCNAQLMMDREGSFIAGMAGRIGKLSVQGTLSSTKVHFSSCCLEREGKIVIVKGKSVCILHEDLKKKEELEGLREQFRELVGVCCDEYGNIFVVDAIAENSVKIKKISDGCVSTLEYVVDKEMVQADENESDIISNLCVVGEYLVGVWMSKQIFRMKIGDEIYNWPGSHHKFEAKTQNLAKEACVILKEHGIPKDLVVYCIKCVLWVQKHIKK